MTEQILQTINQSINLLDSKISRYQEKLESTNINVAVLEKGLGNVNDAVTRAMEGVASRNADVDGRIATLAKNHEKLCISFRRQNKLIIFASGGIFVMMNILWPKISGFMMRFIG